MGEGKGEMGLMGEKMGLMGDGEGRHGGYNERARQWVYNVR